MNDKCLCIKGYTELMEAVKYYNETLKKNKEIELKDFITHGIDVKELLSLNFCNKVLDALNNKECKII